jgi:hypothetical protein
MWIAEFKWENQKGKTHIVKLVIVMRGKAHQ